MNLYKNEPKVYAMSITRPRKWQPKPKHFLICLCILEIIALIDIIK